MKSLPADLAGWLAYISAQHPREIELGLERMGRVAESMALAPFSCPVITVAGTNGKGSCISMLESIYTHAGYRAAAYTSPHLTSFNERIRYGQEYCSDNELIDAFTRIESARQELAVPLTYFEFATLAAMLIFTRRQPDVVLLEVGLGGRLDATNLFPPDIALITSIGLDHTAWLGENREDIGQEKAGIIHACSLAVVADPDAPASVRRIARSKARKSFFLGDEFCYQQRADSSWDWHGPDRNLQALPIPELRGRAQLDNCAGVLMSVECLQRQLPVTYRFLHAGIAAARVRGRFEVLDGDPLIVLDVAHNPDSAALLAENLTTVPTDGYTRAVVAMLQDKDITMTLRKLQDQVNNWYVATLAVPRGETASAIADVLADINVPGIVKQYATVQAAWHSAITESGPNDRIIVFGSFHTVGAIIENLSH